MPLHYRRPEVTELILGASSRQHWQLGLRPERMPLYNIHRYNTGCAKLMKALKVRAFCAAP